MHFHKAQEKPQRWGSFQDVQYAIRVNSEKIYGCDPDNDVLVMPLFWGLPPMDYSGFNNHGTNYGVTYKDGSLNFGGDDYITLPNNESLNITGSITMTARIKIGVNLAKMIIGGYGENSPWVGYGLGAGMNSPFDKLSYWSSSHGSWVSGNSAINDNNWCFVAVSVSGTTATFYKDGLSDGTPTSAVPSSFSGTRAIGAIRDGTSAITGIMAEVRISNVARTAGQIALFHDRPWDLYRPVSRPVYFLPISGWTGKFMGITNPAKIMGIPVANIAKVNGIA